VARRDTSDVRYLIGVSVFPSVSRVRLLDMQAAPCAATSVTFSFLNPDKAGHCLKTIAERATYPEALAAAVAANYGYNSANYSERQLLALVRPGDYWACVLFHKNAAPLYAGGTAAEAPTATIDRLYRDGRLRAAAADPAESLFHQLVLDGIPAFV